MGGAVDSAHPANESYSSEISHSISAFAGNAKACLLLRVNDIKQFFNHRLGLLGSVIVGYAEAEIVSWQMKMYLTIYYADAQAGVQIINRPILSFNKHVKKSP